MPRWGLSGEQRQSRPWGLPERLLRSSKTITSSVEDDIYLTRLEHLFLDSPPVQRLRRVRQLGTSRFVYPDGDHSRFSHILGALRVAQDLMDSALQQNTRPHPQQDLFSEWWDELGQNNREEYERRVAEATVLARLGALLHDVGHLPFSHTVEDELGLLPRHDKTPERFNFFWEQMLVFIEGELRSTPAEAAVADEALNAIGGRLRTEIEHLVLSSLPVPPSAADPKWHSDYPFVGDIVGNTICADLLDYLARDHRNLGLPYALGHRFLDGLFVTRTTHAHRKAHVAIEIERHGRERSDVITELLKCLRFRYEESERVLTHHAKVAADAMIGKLLAMWRDAEWVDAAVALRGVDPPSGTTVDIDLVRQWLTEDTPDETLIAALDERHYVEPIPAAGAITPPPSEQAVHFLDGYVSGRAEELFREWGDDGLLEHLRTENRAATDSRRKAVAELAEGVLNRRLFKMVARSVPEDRVFATGLWERLKGLDERRRLEIQATAYAGVKDGWHLVLWVPNPEMKLKQAFVLVGSDQHVTTLHDHSPRVREIYESHEALWAVSVFAHPSLAARPMRRDVILAWLAEDLGLRGWTGTRTSGERPSKESVAIDYFVKERNLDWEMRELLQSSISALDPSSVPTLDTFLEQLDLIAAAASGLN